VSRKPFTSAKARRSALNIPAPYIDLEQPQIVQVILVPLHTVRRASWRSRWDQLSSTPSQITKPPTMLDRWRGKPGNSTSWRAGSDAIQHRS